MLVYFKNNEKRRLWTYKMGSHPKTVLRSLTLTHGDTEGFLNPGIVLFLLRRRPRVALVFAHVCAGIKTRLGRCRVLVIGEGEEHLKVEMGTIFEQLGVSYEFAGFIPHASLPEYYAQSRLLLLPTSGDCWGVVINEAMLAGTPVITTAWTAAAGALVLHGQNGYVLPLNVDAWVSTASELLSNQPAWDRISECARETAKDFNYDRGLPHVFWTPSPIWNIRTEFLATTRNVCPLSAKNLLGSSC